eukprot:EG_transcript_9227
MASALLPTRPPSVVYHASFPTEARDGEYIRLSSRDDQAFDTFAPVTVGYYFEDFIDPTSLCQSLAVMVGKFPGLTGRIVTLDGASKYFIKPWVNPPSICAIEVPAAIVSTPEHWSTVTDWYPARPGRVAGSTLFQVLFLHSAEQSAGCTLLVSIDHVLADATTCSFFLYDWSVMHCNMFPATHRAVEMVTAGNTEYALGDLTVRRFNFHPKMFSSLKALINADAPPDAQVSVNDILVSMCACAVASRATKPGKVARLAMMADPRGRGMDPNFMGNAAMPINIFVEWALLSSHDLSSVARSVRRSINAALEGMRETCLLEPNNNVTQEALLQWNSWARARNLVEADFGHALKKFEWLNLRILKESHIFIVVPVTVDGGLALQVALPHAMMAYLVTIWNTFVPGAIA